MLGDARRSVVSSANSDVPGAAAGRSLTYKIKTGAEDGTLGNSG